MPQRMSEDDEGIVAMGNAPYYANKTLARLHNFYLVGQIGDPTGYTQWFEIIRNTKETDVVYIHINSEGGSVFTALQLIRAIHEAKGTVVASVEGMCMSAATLIFLNAHQCEVSDHSLFMFHNYSGMVVGKGGEMFDHVNATRKWSARLLNAMYKNFLKPDEIVSILDSKDLWMDAEEVVVRLKKKADLQKENVPEVIPAIEGTIKKTAAKAKAARTRKPKTPLRGVTAL